MKALLKVGVGASLFYAIKSMYMMTKCLLKSGQKFSDIFQTYSGIKQGAPSVVLFLIFMYDFNTIMQEKCINENIIGIIACDDSS